MKQLLCDTYSQENCTTESEMNSICNRTGSVQLSKSDSNIKLSGPSRNPSFRDQNSRIASMSNTDSDEECYRLRHFSITGKGLINRGDSFKIGRSRSNSSVMSNCSNHSKDIPSTLAARSNTASPLISSRESSCSGVADTYLVTMLGSPGVGKSSLVNQFMTSDYLHAYDTFIDDELGEKSVSVLLNGEESELTFVDRPNYNFADENKPHAYCVVYSTSDKASFHRAEQLLQTLDTAEEIDCRVIILVANKTDLVRSRVVSMEDGKEMATLYNCKFIETSVGINHNVDELLVGILTQIRLKLTLLAKLTKSNNSKGSARRKYKRSMTSASIKVKGLLSKVWRTRRSSSQSCVNLQEL